jgi:amidase
MPVKLSVTAGSIALAMSVASSVANGAAFPIEEATIAGIHRALHEKQVTCREIVQAYLDRITAFDHKGPSLNAILALNSKALAEAQRLDADSARSGPVGPLHCIPVASSQATILALS